MKQTTGLLNSDWIVFCWGHSWMAEQLSILLPRTWSQVGRIAMALAFSWMAGNVILIISNRFTSQRRGFQFIDFGEKLAKQLKGPWAVGSLNLRCHSFVASLKELAISQARQLVIIHPSLRILRLRLAMKEILYISWGCILLYDVVTPASISVKHVVILFYIYSTLPPTNN